MTRLRLPSVADVTAGALSFAITFEMWWIYVDHVVGRPLRRSNLWNATWTYVNIPLFMAATAFGAAALTFVTRGEQSSRTQPDGCSPVRSPSRCFSPGWRNWRSSRCRCRGAGRGSSSAGCASASFMDCRQRFPCSSRSWRTVSRRFLYSRHSPWSAFWRCCSESSLVPACRASQRPLGVAAHPACIADCALNTQASTDYERRSKTVRATEWLQTPPRCPHRRAR
jgi:hypothetical protein